MESLLRIVLEFIGSLLEELVKGVLYFDAPSTLRPTEQAALQKRTAPYYAASVCVYSLFVLVLVGLILWCIITPRLPLPALQYCTLGLLCFTLGTPLIARLLCCLRPARWCYADFHAACALRVSLGSSGFSIGLLLLHVFLVLLFIVGGN